MYITYGSPAQIDPKPLPPHQRYISDRVWYVRQLAKDAGEEFAIITAEYGLVFEENYIPMHDHTLSSDEVERLSNEIAKTLQKKGASSVTFFVIPEEWQEKESAFRYDLVLQKACLLAKIPYTLKPITIPLGERTHGTPSPVRPENIEIGGPYTMNKKADPTYLLRAQDEKGLWQNVRTSTFLPDLQIKARSLSKKFSNQKVEIVELPKDTKFPF
jgi:hypothetical protein